MKSNKYLILGCLLFWSVFVNAQNEKSRWSLKAMAGVNISKYGQNEFGIPEKPKFSPLITNFESIKLGYNIRKSLGAYLGINNTGFGYFINKNQDYYQFQNGEFYQKNQKHIDRMLVIQYGFKIDFSKSFYMNVGGFNAIYHTSVDKTNSMKRKYNIPDKNFMGVNLGFGYDWLKINNFRIGNEVNFYYKLYGRNAKNMQTIGGVFVGFCATMEL